MFTEKENPVDMQRYASEGVYVFVWVCVCVCVRERERERECKK